MLGCGPAGMVAAHAAVLDGHDVTVHSKRRKSELYGAQFLHAAVPWLPGPAPVTVDYRLTGGDWEGYRRKVYGLRDDIEVSPQVFSGPMPAWDIRAAYSTLWGMYFPLVRDSEITPMYVDRLLNEVDLVISTIPAQALCYLRNLHYFEQETVWAAGDAPERGIFLPDSMRPPLNTIICNGDEAAPWYRSSNVYGVATVEWPSSVEKPDGATLVSKPLHTNCDCFRRTVARVGRYGQWKKGVLVSDVYLQTMNALHDA